MPRSDSTFEILEKINPNAYKVDLPGEYWVSTTFNVPDLGPYYEENEELPSLRSNFLQAAEDDGGHPIKSNEDQSNKLGSSTRSKEAR